MGENSCSKIDDFFMTVLGSSYRTDLGTPFQAAQFFLGDQIIGGKVEEIQGGWLCRNQNFFFVGEGSEVLPVVTRPSVEALRQPRPEKM